MTELDWKISDTRQEIRRISIHYETSGERTLSSLLRIGKKHSLALSGPKVSATYGQLRKTIKQFPQCTSPRRARCILLFPREESDMLAISLLAAMQSGFGACPLDAGITSISGALEEAAQQLRSEAIILSQGKFSENLDLSPFSMVIVVRESMGSLEYDLVRSELKTETGNEENEEGEEGEAVLVLRTSGTTGKPKVVPLLEESIVINTINLANSMNLTSDDICLNAMPLFHIGGIMCPLLSTLATGGQLILTAGFDPEEFVGFLQQHEAGQATWYYAAPTLHKSLLLYVRANIDASVETKLRFIRSGAAHLPHQDALDLAETFDCVVMPTYSMSECMPICSVSTDWNVAECSAERENTVGRIIGPEAMRIADADGNALPYGEIGEVLIRGRGVMRGYEGGESYAKWFPTGDRGTIDRQGYLTLHGRSKEIIKRGGEQISLHEVDEVIRKHRGVGTVVSFGISNPFWGEELAVAIVPNRKVKADLLTREILSLATESLGSDKTPKQVFIVKEEDLPKSSTGKYLRHQMATSLNAKPVDTKAQEVISGALGQSEVEKKDKRRKWESLSPAISGIRIIVSCWVVQTHIGFLPYLGWEALRNFTLSMPIFAILIGLSLAGAASPIRTKDRRSFILERLSTAFGLYWFGVLVSIPAFLVVCHSGASNCFYFGGYGIISAPDATADINSMVGYWLQFVFGLVVFSTGLGYIFTIPLFYQPINGIYWFQTQFIVCVITFPLFHSLFRKARKPVLWVCALLLFSIIFALTMTFTGIFDFVYTGIYYWLPLFLIGIGMERIFTVFDSKKNVKWAILPRSRRAFAWAVTTDCLTLALISFLVIAAAVDCRFPLENSNVCLTQESYMAWHDAATNNYPYSVFNGTIFRVSGLYSQILGSGRLGLIVAVPWLYGLALGHGLTARILRTRFLSLWLAPLSYGVYLLHWPVAQYISFIINAASGEPVGSSIGAFNNGLVPLQVSPWVAAVSLVISMLLTAFYNEFINPRAIRFCYSFWSFLFKLGDVFFLGCCCGVLGKCCMDRKPSKSRGLFCSTLQAYSVCPPEGSVLGWEDDEELTMQSKVVRAIERLTGTTGIGLEVRLTEIGLDSLGSTALIGVLRRTIPEANAVRPHQVNGLTVGQLVSLLEQK
jgi:acyl-CoA synthetase (AMP-forming)/AMP-acid ligase II/peptidoglycan/LPS O-acetylase OafA/YrhL